MRPVVLLPDGRLRVPCVEFDAGGVAHFTREIGPEHPDYARFRGDATEEADILARRSEQAELDRYLSEHAAEGDAMLGVLERQVQQRNRPTG